MMLPFAGGVLFKRTSAGAAHRITRFTGAGSRAPLSAMRMLKEISLKDGVIKEFFDFENKQGLRIYQHTAARRTKASSAGYTAAAATFATLIFLINQPTPARAAADTAGISDSVPRKSFSIAPDTDLKTVSGVSDALNSLVTFLEDERKRNAGSTSALWDHITALISRPAPAADTVTPPTSVTENAVAAVFSIEEHAAINQVLNSIPSLIGNRDDKYQMNKMEILGNPRTGIAGNLKKHLKLLLKTVSLPSEPSYYVTSEILLKTLVTMQKMMKADDTSYLESLSKPNIKIFFQVGTGEALVDVLKTYLALGDQVKVEGGGGGQQGQQCTTTDRTASAARVITECCKTISVMTNCRVDSGDQYGKVPGSIEVLVDVLKAYGSCTSDDSSAVVEACCDAISEVCFNRGNRQKFASTDVFTSLVAVLKTHGKNTNKMDAIDACCKAIYRLSMLNRSFKAKFNELNMQEVLLFDVAPSVYYKDKVLEELRS